MRTFAVLAVMASLNATPASADDASGVFVGMSGGRANAATTLENLDLGNVGVDLDLEGSSPVWGAFGGYRLNQHFGVRGGYMDFQTFDDRLDMSPVGDVPEVELDMEGWMLGVDAYMPLASWASLGARAGYMDWKSRLRIGDYGLRSSDSGADPFFGGGLEVNFGPSFSIEASYTRFDLEGSDVDSASLGVRLGF
jgi:hypothetical protein